MYSLSLLPILSSIPFLLAMSSATSTTDFCGLLYQYPNFMSRIDSYYPDSSAGNQFAFLVGREQNYTREFDTVFQFTSVPHFYSLKLELFFREDSSIKNQNNSTVTVYDTDGKAIEPVSWNSAPKATTPIGNFNLPNGHPTTAILIPVGSAKWKDTMTFRAKLTSNMGAGNVQFNQQNPGGVGGYEFMGFRLRLD